MCASIIDKYLNQQNIYEYFIIRRICLLSQHEKQQIIKMLQTKIIRFVNYNKHKDIENWSRKQLLLYSPFKSFEHSLVGTHVSWHDAYYEIKENISIIRSKFNCNMQINKHTNEEYDVMNLQSNSSHLQNIWNDDIGDTCPLPHHKYIKYWKIWFEKWFHHLIM